MSWLRDESQSEARPAPRRGALASLTTGRDKDWDLAASALVTGLLAEDRRTHPQWLALLGPPDAVLIALRNVCADEGIDPVTRSTAAEALAGVLVTQHDSAGLARALVVAQPEAALVLLNQLERMSDKEDAVNELVALGMSSAQSHDERAIERHAMAAIALAFIGRADALLTAFAAHA